MWSFKETTFSVLGGLNSVDNAADIPQGPHDENWDGILRMAQANNVFSPQKRYDLQTRPGMADVRSTAINAAGIFTGMVHMGEIADKFLMAVSIAAGSHNFYDDVANPPTAIAGGTNFTIGADNLVDWLLFRDGSAAVAIALSRQRDLPQSFTSSATRANFTIAGTGLTSLKPAIGEIFGQRAIYGDYNQDGTVHDDRVAYSDLRDGNLISDITVQFYSFETAQKDKVRALRKFGDVCLVGKMNNVYLLAVTPQSAKPYQQRELVAGRYKGPVSQQATLEADGKLWWMGQTNIHSMDAEGRIADVGDIIRPTIAGLSDTRREFTVAGYDSVNDLVLFAVSDGSDTKHQTIIAVSTKKKNCCYIWTLSVNAMAQRLVTSENRLILGGYVGKFRNWNSGATGNLDDASAAIDADIFTPRHHLGSPDWVKLFGGVKVTFDPQASSEAVTLQYRLNDDSSWTSFAASPYTVTGTANDVDTKFFPLMKAGTHLQLRFRDANSGQVIRAQKYTIPWKLLHPMVT